MMKFVFSVFAAFAAVAAFAAIPETAEGWYEPEDGFTKQESKGTVYFGYDKKTGTWKEKAITVDDEGKISPQLTEKDFGNNYELRTAYEALVIACRNAAELKNQMEAIETLGKNLHAVFSTDGITIEGTDPNGKKVSYKLTFKSGHGIGSDGGTIAENPSLAYKHTDEKSLRWTEDNKAELFGWGEKAVSGDFLETHVANGVGIPIRRTFGGELEYLNWYGIDNLSLAPHPTTKRLELSGWANDPATMTPLAEAMTQEDGDVFSDYELVVRNASKGLNYVSVGKLKAGGAPVDGESITTNVTEGALVQGVASLRGWAKAADSAIAYRSDDTLAWKKAADWVNTQSLQWYDNKFQLRDTHIYSGSASRYFGTRHDGVVGWHELPNVTTNYVAADEVTITANPAGVSVQEGEKVLGLRGFDYTYGGDAPLLLANIGGMLSYIPFSAGTNDFCGCSNNWARTSDWFGVGEFTDNEISFGKDFPTLIDFLSLGKGVVRVTSPDEKKPAVFDNAAGKDVTASFAAPGNWADGASVGVTNGAYQIAGWGQAEACGASVSAMLENPASADAREHQMLARVNGRMHYVPIGAGIKSGNAIRFVGTDNTEQVVGSGTRTNRVVFASATDSNVHVSVGKDEETGDVRIEIGVYYLDEATAEGRQ